METDHPAARRFAYHPLPEGDARLRVRRAPTPIGCIATVALGVFTWAWTKGAHRLLTEARDRKLDTNGVMILLMVAPFLVLLWFIGPNTMLFATRLHVGKERLSVQRLWRRRQVDYRDIAAIERIIYQQTHRKDDPRQTISVHYACQIRLKNGKAFEFGNGQEPGDLDWLVSTLSSAVGLPPPKPPA